jgi:hypothetical protein
MHHAHRMTTSGETEAVRAVRLLYLDDSGKAHPNDESKFLVYAGISVNALNWGDSTDA